MIRLPDLARHFVHAEQLALQCHHDHADLHLAEQIALGAQARALGEAVTAATQALALARQRYQAGLIDFTTLLDAQRTLLTLQTSQIGAEVDLRQNLIRLFKALGGGLSAADLAALPVRAAATR